MSDNFITAGIEIGSLSSIMAVPGAEPVIISSLVYASENEDDSLTGELAAERIHDCPENVFRPCDFSAELSGDAPLNSITAEAFSGEIIEALAGSTDKQIAGFSIALPFLKNNSAKQLIIKAFGSRNAVAVDHAQAVFRYTDHVCGGKYSNVSGTVTVCGFSFGSLAVSSLKYENGKLIDQYTEKFPEYGIEAWIDVAGDMLKVKADAGTGHQNEYNEKEIHQLALEVIKELCSSRSVNKQVPFDGGKVTVRMSVREFEAMIDQLLQDVINHINTIVRHFGRTRYPLQLLILPEEMKLINAVTDYLGDYYDPEEYIFAEAEAAARGAVWLPLTDEQINELENGLTSEEPDYELETEQPESEQEPEFELETEQPETEQEPEIEPETEQPEEKQELEIEPETEQPEEKQELEIEPETEQPEEKQEPEIEPETEQPEAEQEPEIEPETEQPETEQEPEFEFETEQPESEEEPVFEPETEQPVEEASVLEENPFNNNINDDPFALSEGDNPFDFSPPPADHDEPVDNRDVLPEVENVQDIQEENELEIKEYPFGVDYGSANISLGYFDGANTALTEISGKKSYPAYVYVDENKKTVLGEEAWKKYLSRSINAFLAGYSQCGDIASIIFPTFSFNHSGSFEQPRFKFRPEEMASALLKKVFAIVRNNSGAVPSKTAIAIPPVRNFYIEEFGMVLRRAAKDAGLPKICTIPRDVAVCIHYGLGYLGKGEGIGETVIVFEMGSKSVNLTALKINEDSYSTICSSGGSGVGTDSRLDCLIRTARSQYIKKSGIKGDILPDIVDAITENCIIAMSDLAEDDSTIFRVPVPGKNSVVIELNRNDLEFSRQEMIFMVSSSVNEMSMRMNGQNVSRILLAGGEAATNDVISDFTRYFSGAEICKEGSETAVLDGTVLFSARCSEDLFSGQNEQNEPETVLNEEEQISGGSDAENQNNNNDPLEDSAFGSAPFGALPDIVPADDYSDTDDPFGDFSLGADPFAGFGGNGDSDN